MKRILKYIFIFTLIFYSIFLLALYLNQENLTFHPIKTEKDYKYNIKTPFAEKWFISSNKNIHSIFFKSNIEKGMIIYLHGNASNLEAWSEVAEELVQNTGWSLWMLDYPGYGKSEGQISSEEQLHQVVTDFYKLVKAESSSSKIVIFGRSLGTGLATRLASENNISGLILEAPYYSIKRVALERFPIVPGFLVKYPIESYNWFKKISTNTLIFHGNRDEVIPYQHAKDLLSLNSNSMLITLDGGKHDSLRQFPEYWKNLMAYLDSI